VESFERIHGPLLISFTLFDLLLWVRKKKKELCNPLRTFEISSVTLNLSAITVIISWSSDVCREHIKMVTYGINENILPPTTISKFTFLAQNSEPSLKLNTFCAVLRYVIRILFNNCICTAC